MGGRIESGLRLSRVIATPGGGREGRREGEGEGESGLRLPITSRGGGRGEAVRVTTI